MIKPVGALCNLDCTYCYYLPTKSVFDGHEHRMKLTTLEEIFAGILPRFGDQVTVIWQGGEPTLAGLDFFQKAVEFQNKYKRPSQSISHALQTNGTLLDDGWCRFLKEHEFLVGLSIDGPPKLHDHYRLTNRGEASSKQVFCGLRALQKQKVEFNALCVLNDVNVHHPDELWDYLISLGTRWLQFIPAIEWEQDPDRPGQNVLAPYSPDPVAYGKFLCRAFDLWFEKYRHRVSVRIFDAVVMKLVMDKMPYCILDGSCHREMTIEHDGAVFGCDHFIERRWQLAQIGQPEWHNGISLDGSIDVGLTVHRAGYVKADEHVGRDIVGHDDLPLARDMTGDCEAASGHLDTRWFERADAERLGTFNARKLDLPEKCVNCRFKPLCHGGCPKHRSQGGDVPEASVLCEAYIMFYEHTLDRFEWLAGFLRRDEQPPEPVNAKRTKKANREHAAR